MESKKPDFSKPNDIFGLEPVSVRAEFDPPVKEQTNQLDVVYAGLGPRILAYLLDSVFLLIPTLFTALALFDDLGDPNNSFGLSILAVAIWSLYYGFTESSDSQATFGKSICGLKVIDENGGKLTFGKAAFRYISQIVSFVPLGYGIWRIVIDDRKQAWHDQIVGAYVVKKNSTKKVEGS